MNKKLQEYNKRLGDVQQIQKQTLIKLKQQYTQAFVKQLQHSAEQHWNRYRQCKKSTKTELDAIQYYLKLYNQTYPSQTDQQDNQQQQMGGGKQQTTWSEMMKKVNLYSLYKTIDDKLSYNQALLTQFPFVVSFPLQSHLQYQKLMSKSTILQQQIKQYSLFISTLFTKLNRPPKDQLTQLKAIQQKYTKLLNHSVCLSQHFDLKIKDTHCYVISAISTHKFIKSVDLSMISASGVLDADDYDKLGSALIKHRFYLQTVQIKLMDMQFCQEKCDILKRYLKKLKILNKLIIHNYYSQCKLGQFVDFNWHPYRKTINIKSAVWK